MSDRALTSFTWWLKLSREWELLGVGKLPGGGRRAARQGDVYIPFHTWVIVALVFLKVIDTTASKGSYRPLLGEGWVPNLLPSPTLSLHTGIMAYYARMGVHCVTCIYRSCCTRVVIRPVCACYVTLRWLTHAPLPLAARSACIACDIDRKWVRYCEIAYTTPHTLTTCT